MGGYAALVLSQSRPDLFETLVLANTRAGADSPEARADRRNCSPWWIAKGRPASRGT